MADNQIDQLGAMLSEAETKPIEIETLEPIIIRLNKSRPYLSVPKINFFVTINSSSIFLKSVFLGNLSSDISFVNCKDGSFEYSRY